MQKVYFSSLCGIRESNEDKHTIIQNLDGKNTLYKPFNYFSIYDGHGGNNVSKFLDETLYQYFMRTDMEFDPTTTLQKCKDYIESTYSLLQHILMYEKRYMAELVGSAAIVLIQYQLKTKQNIYVMNLGDSRAIKCDGNNIAIPFTKDHKPNVIEEKNRIHDLAGTIKFDGEDWRVKNLSLSRAFGDLDTRPYVSYIPDIFKYEIAKSDKFIVMGCDGLWDVMSNQDVVNFILEIIQNIELKKIPQNTNIAKIVAEHAINDLKSGDNVSVIIIFL